MRAFRKKLVAIEIGVALAVCLMGCSPKASMVISPDMAYAPVRPDSCSLAAGDALGLLLFDNHMVDGSMRLAMLEGRDFYAVRASALADAHDKD